MKYVLAIVIVSFLGGGFYWWNIKESPVEVSETEQQPTETQTTDQEEIPSGVQTYRNDEWGIVFEYPNDWEIREPAFGSAASLFNLAAEPTNPFRIKSIVVNLTTKDWGESAMKKMEKDGIVFEDRTVANLKAVYFESAYEGLPQTDYLVLVNDSYWIDISGKKEYEDVLNQVIASLEITPVKIPSSN